MSSELKSKKIKNLNAYIILCISFLIALYLFEVIIPFAVACPSSDWSTARHIEHCAETSSTPNTNKHNKVEKKTKDCFLDIIG